MTVPVPDFTKPTLPVILVFNVLVPELAQKKISDAPEVMDDPTSPRLKVTPVVVNKPPLARVNVTGVPGVPKVSVVALVRRHELIVLLADNVREALASLTFWVVVAVVKSVL